MYYDKKKEEVLVPDPNLVQDLEKAKKANIIKLGVIVSALSILTILIIVIASGSSESPHTPTKYDQRTLRAS
jgi:hypothetical protein